MVLHGTIRGEGMNVIMNPSPRLLAHWGGQYWPWVLENGEWWRCITYAFTHGGLIHLGFNMVALYQIGPPIELEIGWQRLITVYIFTTIVATVAGLFWHPNIVVVGASGALLGLIGFASSYYHRIGSRFALQRRNLMLQWALMALVFGFVVGADNAAHLGGAISGAAIGWIMPVHIRAQRKTDKLFKIIAIFCTCITIKKIIYIPISWINS